MIRFNQVTKVYESANKKVKAVDQVDFEVEEGNICVFLGPSGCGKTSLLRMVNRLISITSGSIEVNHRNIDDCDVTELRRSIGYVIQQVGLFPNMTIEENIGLVPKMLGWDRAKIHHRYNELMELMGLNPDEYRKYYPWELSGGQQQRIGVARALAADPPVMLMDEPFGALDPIIRERIQNEFLRIQQNVKKTILFVSHDIDEAIRLGDRIAIFNGGKLMQYGTPNDILSNPANDFVKDFVGQDRTIKRLNLLTVRDFVSSKRLVKHEIVTIKQGEDCQVRLNMSLRTALAVVLASPNGESMIMDDQDHYCGLLRLEDFSKLAHMQPFGTQSMAQ